MKNWISFVWQFSLKLCLNQSRFLRDELNGQNQELVSLRSDINKIISKAETGNSSTGNSLTGNSGNSVTGSVETGNSETEVKKQMWRFDWWIVWGFVHIWRHIHFEIVRLSTFPLCHTVMGLSRIHFTPYPLRLWRHRWTNPTSRSYKEKRMTLRSNKAQCEGQRLTIRVEIAVMLLTISGDLND